MLKVVSLLLVFVAAAAILVGTTHVVRASGAGAEGVLHGITIADNGVHIRITGDKLNCIDTSDGAVSTQCQTTVLGDTMVVSAMRHPMNHFTFTECSVEFRGRTTYCYARLYSITVSAADAVVTGLGLSSDELQEARRENLLTSRSEASWHELARWTALAAGIAASLFGLAWIGSRFWTRSLVAIACGLCAFVATYAYAWLLLPRGGFID